MSDIKTTNIACRLFKEQINLINQLPKEDRANVLYLSIMNAFNQFENQNDNQIENQNEYAYISISSSISNSIIDLLSKNIVFKEYNNNYGGKRDGSGRKEKKKSKNLTCDKESVKQKHPTIDEIKNYCIERNNNVDAERFFDYYTSNGWKVGKNPMKDWQATVRNWEKSSSEQKTQNITEQEKEDFWKKWNEARV